MAAPSKSALNAINISLTVLATAIAATALWFYSEVVWLAQLRNYSHYALDFTVYWPQAAPWLFVLASLFTLIACGIGFCGTKRSNPCLLRAHAGVLYAASLVLAIVAIVVLVCAVDRPTTEFFRDTIWDAYHQLSARNNQVEGSLWAMERRLSCCGPDSPRDYKQWRDELPQSCCDIYRRTWFQPEPMIQECGFASKLANERPGCIHVAAQYARITLYSLSGGALVAAILGAVLASLALSRARYVGNNNKRNHKFMAQQIESESGKVLI